MLSSSGQRGDARRMAEAGFAAYLTKPIRQSILLATLRAAYVHAQNPQEHHAIITRHTLAERGALPLVPDVSATSDSDSHQLDKSNPSGHSDRHLDSMGVALAPSQAGDPAAGNAAEASTANALANSGHRLLLVEDNAVNQMVASRMLRLGHAVELATDGKQAVDMIAANRYDLVFMDCQMPVMDGYQATEEIRRTEPPDRRVVIVAMTANALQTDRQRCIESGMDDYLSKPINKAEVVAVLCRHLPASIPQSTGTEPLLH